MDRMLSVKAAIFLELQLVRCGPLVLGRRIVPPLALRTRQRDYIPHRSPLLQNLAHNPCADRGFTGQRFEWPAQSQRAGKLHLELDEYQRCILHRVGELEWGAGNEWLSKCKQRWRWNVYLHPHLFQSIWQRQ